MMRFFRQLTAWVLCLFLLWGAAFALAEGETAAIAGEESRTMDEETERIIRFGDGAVVETGEDGEPVSVNGYPLEGSARGVQQSGPKHDLPDDGGFC